MDLNPEALVQLWGALQGGELSIPVDVSPPRAFAEGRAAAVRMLRLVLPQAIRMQLEAKIQDGSLVEEARVQREKASSAGLEGPELDAAVAMVLMLNMLKEIKDALSECSQREQAFLAKTRREEAEPVEPASRVA